MRFLLPVGGIVDHRFGILTSPQHSFAGIPAGVKGGMQWAADMGCLDGPSYVKRFNAEEGLVWLHETMAPYRDTNLFVTIPDVVGAAADTIDAFEEFFPLFEGWSLAFVAQDGQENLRFPTGWDTLFVGGSTQWKLESGALSVIHRAQRMGKHIHIGRVNWWKRYEHFRGLEGSDDWTCDGTRPRFEGTERTVEAWADYQQRPYNLRLALPSRDSSG